MLRRSPSRPAGCRLKRRTEPSGTSCSSTRCLGKHNCSAPRVEVMCYREGAIYSTCCIKQASATRTIELGCRPTSNYILAAGPQGQERQDEAGAGAAQGARRRARDPERHPHPKQPGRDARPVRLRLRGVHPACLKTPVFPGPHFAATASTHQQHHDGPLPVLLQGLLGDARHFKEYFSRPIETGNDRHAVERMRQVLGQIFE